MAKCGSCGGGGGRVARRQTSPSPARRRATSNDASVQAAAGKQYEVISARGGRTGRRFSSLVAAEGYARRIAGTVEPL